MIRELVCNQCQQVVREDELFVHLVTKHNWKAARRELSSSHSEPTPSPYREQRAFPPRLGPMRPSISSAAFVPKKCKFCQRAVDPAQLVQHLAECQKRKDAKVTTKKSTSVASAAGDKVPCPHCKIEVGKRKLNKHIKKVHPSLIAINQKEATVPPLSQLSPNQCICPHCKVSVGKKKYKQHLEQRCPKRPASTSGVKLSNTCHDPDIAAFIARTAAPEEMGRFGKPQAKIRHGTYGLSNMEYDAWGRND
ncbi:MAG: hypothetical protein ACRC91_05470 [Aeromonas sp.]